MVITGGGVYLRKASSWVWRNERSSDMFTFGSKMVYMEAGGWRARGIDIEGLKRRGEVAGSITCRQDQFIVNAPKDGQCNCNCDSFSMRLIGGEHRDCIRHGDLINDIQRMLCFLYAKST